VAFEEGARFCQFAFAADEGCRLKRQIGEVQAQKGREVLVPQLIEAPGLGEVFEPVLAEVAEVRVDEPGRGLGDTI
jgi:hypothetical protein